MNRTNTNLNKELSLRLQEYGKEVRDFWLTLMLPMAAVFGTLVFGGCYWLSLHGERGTVDWRIAAALFTLGVMILPYYMFKPSRPTKLSIAYDGLLNQIGEACSKQRQN
jgi:hypothetical protein